jgi:bifunctional ADP-heptose synthase (sugar kinase/adenylyltransferase)
MCGENLAYFAGSTCSGCNVTKREYRLGGAGNVLLNVQALGAEAHIRQIAAVSGAGDRVISIYSMLCCVGTSSKSDSSNF